MAVAVTCLTAMIFAPSARAQANPSATELITNGPQLSPGDQAGAAEAAQNRRDSERYESLVRSNPSFRATRERKECGLIADAKARADCSATFDK